MKTYYFYLWTRFTNEVYIITADCRPEQAVEVGERMCYMFGLARGLFIRENEV